ncbi:FliM/FliN family flagellar motor switch protein [Oricola cellulosilytica]|uniref:Flagellar motor switch protein FliN n=1 Tax=Oricola cellulosilytica TaxID=1429082 RepID=A0A4R0PKY6_9HYPH|nr:FliM/FliN family flagellar motor switch protein [Oricola cellulosilytica]TCD16189.1 flagellar motor switch protein FliN [Oricola cellulosilytica]
MSEPKLSPLDDLDLSDDDSGLPSLGGDTDLPDLEASPDPLDDAIAELQDVLGKDQAMGPLEGETEQDETGAARIGDGKDTGLQNLVMSLPVQMDVVIGSAEMPVSELIGMEAGSVVALNRKIGDSVEICVNGMKIASGEIQTLDDDPSRLGVKITELVES